MAAISETLFLVSLPPDQWSPFRVMTESLPLTTRAVEKEEISTLLTTAVGQLPAASPPPLPAAIPAVVLVTTPEWFDALDPELVAPIPALLVSDPTDPSILPRLDTEHLVDILAVWNGAIAPESLTVCYARLCQRIGLQQQRARLRERVARLENQLGCLTQVGPRIASLLNLDEVLEQTVRSVAELLDVHRVSVMLVEEDGATLVIRATYGFPPDVPRHLRVPIGEGIAGRVAATGEPVFVRDISSLSLPRRHPEEYPGPSFMSLPLVVGGRTIGVLNVSSKGSGRHFGSNEFDLMLSIFGTIATALENARLYQLLERRASEAERARTQIERLEKLHLTVAANLSHELMTPLTAINGYAELLEMDSRSGQERVLTSEQRVTYLSAILQRVQQIRSTVDEMAELFDILLDHGSLTLRAATVRELLLAGWRAAQELFGDAADAEAGDTAPNVLQIDIDPGHVVSCDPEKVVVVLRNLFSNALKFSTPRSSLGVRTEVVAGPGPGENVHADGEFVRISVQNEGVYIPPEEIEAIFGLYRQLGDPLVNKPKGIGLGLPLCRAIVEHHHGMIWADSRSGGLTTFSFTLPRRRSA
ncbi:MAG: GAF domain-containing protein [Candidatus Schekmanbacteria bacterium]|nr:GAF domain-containing protein [Candidatus Schekmanbacteria bacterium]